VSIFDNVVTPNFVHRHPPPLCTQMGAPVTLAGGEGRGRGGHRVPVGAMGDGQGGFAAGAHKYCAVLRPILPSLSHAVLFQQCRPFLLISIGDPRFGHVTIFDNFSIRQFPGFIAIWCLSCLGNNSFFLTLFPPLRSGQSFGNPGP